MTLSTGHCSNIRITFSRERGTVLHINTAELGKRSRHVPPDSVADAFFRFFTQSMSGYSCQCYRYPT